MIKFTTKQTCLKKELDEFIESLNTEQFKKITNFFDSMPRLRHIIKVVNPNTKVENEILIEGLQSFLVQGSHMRA